MYSLLGEQQSQEKMQRVTFEQCLSLVEQNGRYQRKLFVLLAFLWIFASVFMSIQFYLYKVPIYLRTDGQPCAEHDLACIREVCSQPSPKVQPQNTLTNSFSFFCDEEWLRLMFKTFPLTLSFVGLLLYGYMADLKGRKVAIKISWRMFTLGVLLYSLTQTAILRTLGYVIACVHCYPSLVCQFILLFQQTKQHTRINASLLILSTLFVGPLVLAFVGELMLESQLGIRWSLLLLCGVPTFILSFFVDVVMQSPLYAYRQNKVLCFNILNQIAKQNGLQPIMIDLSQSSWIIYKEEGNKIRDMFEYPTLLRKIIASVLIMFVLYYNNMLAQVSLDRYTNTQQRGYIISLTTSLADIVLCCFIDRLRNRFREGLVVVVLLGLGRTWLGLWGNEDAVRIGTLAAAPLTRFFSEICYDLMLIWAIQAFPTDGRGKLASFSFCACSLGCVLAYSLKDYPQTAIIISVFLTIIIIFFVPVLELHLHGMMKDTFSLELYDSQDYFAKYAQLGKKQQQCSISD